MQCSICKMVLRFLRLKLSQKLGFLLYIVALLWAFSVVSMMFNTAQHPSSKSVQDIEQEIAKLSIEYVRKLAMQNKDSVDGPFSCKFTGYEMKKSLAVILEEVMQRVSNLETEVEKLSLKGGGNFSKLLAKNMSIIQDLFGNIQNKVDLKGLVLGAQEDCSLTEEQKQRYPHCEGKLFWMRKHWQSDSCYGENGVDGTDCSIRLYLSEIETWCPLLPGRIKKNTSSSDTVPPAKMNFELQTLLDKLVNPGKRPNYNWIRGRVTRMWPSWVVAAKSLQSKYNITVPRKRIYVHLGLLSRKSGFKIAEGSLTGGPLGELVQWSDVICTLYILGHDLTVTSEFEELTEILNHLPTAKSQCQTRDKLHIDAIFTDIVGLRQFKMKVKNGYGKFKCLLRVVDSFGTEPAFNYDLYAKSHKKKTSWGMQNLEPSQFFTMFPHSPDNSFMGFVIEDLLSNGTQSNTKNIERKNQAVVYGKAEYMWKGKDSYLDAFHQFVDIHGTVFDQEKQKIKLPSYVQNHGILPGPELHSLLRQSKLFIGLGFPYEGPAPLEAIAQGNVFINPKFSPPHSSLNTKFFKGKPTERGLTSQHPYAELLIGEPYVKTVDITDKTAVANAIQQALKDIDSGRVPPFIPYEYTQEGMLQRVSSYIQNQEFCSNDAPKWPPVDDIKIILSQVGQSCKDACWQNNLVCERSYFPDINTPKSLEKYTGKSCSQTQSLEDIFYPTYNPSNEQCFLQKQSLLFSCVGEHNALMRLCPCRTFIKEQTALCKKCL